MDNGLIIVITRLNWTAVFVTAVILSSDNNNDSNNKDNSFGLFAKLRALKVYGNTSLTIERVRSLAQREGKNEDILLLMWKEPPYKFYDWINLSLDKPKVLQFHLSLNHEVCLFISLHLGAIGPRIKRDNFRRIYGNTACYYCDVYYPATHETYHFSIQMVKKSDGSSVSKYYVYYDCGDIFPVNYVTYDLKNRHFNVIENLPKENHVIEPSGWQDNC